MPPEGDDHPSFMRHPPLRPCRSRWARRCAPTPTGLGIRPRPATPRRVRTDRTLNARRKERRIEEPYADIDAAFKDALPRLRLARSGSSWADWPCVSVGPWCVRVPLPPLESGSWRRVLLARPNELGYSPSNYANDHWTEEPARRVHTFCPCPWCAMMSRTTCDKCGEATRKLWCKEAGCGDVYACPDCDGWQCPNCKGPPLVAPWHYSLRGGQSPEPEQTTRKAWRRQGLPVPPPCPHCGGWLDPRLPAAARYRCKECGNVYLASLLQWQRRNWTGAVTSATILLVAAWGFVNVSSLPWLAVAATACAIGVAGIAQCLKTPRRGRPGAAE